jgi:Domain of unknown function (DUF4145)
MLLECKICEALVDAKEISSYEYRELLEVDYPAPWDSKDTLAVCPKCNQPMLATESRFEDKDHWEKPVRLFPARDRELHDSVPRAIREAFGEARTCIRAKAFIAAAIMCRKTLEGICSAHGVKSSGSLAAQLKKLKDDGVIENRLFEWAEALRTVGNEAAHGTGFVVSREDANDTLEFTEALIEYVFTYRDKFEQFRKRRAEAASAPKKTAPKAREV